MHLSTVETVLEYQVQSPTHFCFNIEAAHWPTQKILSERLAISSGVTPHSYTDPRSGNRFIRFDAQPGLLHVSYKAEVEVHTPPAEPGLRETPVGQVPDEIFPYLLATRYCESDLLSNDSVRLFGQLPPGHERVQAIVTGSAPTSRTRRAAPTRTRRRSRCSSNARACAATSRTWASPSAGR
jgi:hypothetical protein